MISNELLVYPYANLIYLEYTTTITTKPALMTVM